MVHLGSRLMPVVLAASLVFVAPGVSVGANRSLDLRTADLKLLGVRSIAPAGDVNADGALDLVVGECRSDNSAISHVLFGPLQPGRFELGQGPNAGFRIKDGLSEDGACRVTGAGDVNGDGLDDVLVGANLADNSGGTDSGTVYVIFGKRTSESVSLKDFDENRQVSQGFRIDGPNTLSLVGQYMASSEDISGDGLDDLVIGSFGGSTYIVFGKGTATPVNLETFDLNAQGMHGYRIDTPSPDKSDGYAVGGAGDVNADGIPDVIVGVIPKVRNSAGSAYVIFGKADPVPVDVRDLAFRGFRIKGIRKLDATGNSVATAGDVDSDGKADVVVGAPRTNALNGTGSAWVIFGKKNNKTVQLDSLGQGGYEIKGARNRDSAGWSVASLGDMNRDSKDDVLVGAIFASHRGRRGNGSVYVVYGKKSSRRIRLANLGWQGYRMDGERTGDAVGWIVASAGDLDSDGISDIVTRAPGRERGYVVWGIKPR